MVDHTSNKWALIGPDVVRAMIVLYLAILTLMALKLTPVISTSEPTNYVTINGYKYATLANTYPLDFSGKHCQNNYLELPSGWIIAPRNCQSWFALGCYGWDTHCLVIADGNSYRGGNHSSSQRWLNCGGGGQLLTSGTSYRVNGCNREILITNNLNAVYAVCSSNPTSCEQCSAGKSSSNGATPCTDCVAGKYMSITGATACKSL